MQPSTTCSVNLPKSLSSQTFTPDHHLVFLLINFFPQMENLQISEIWWTWIVARRRNTEQICSCKSNVLSHFPSLFLIAYVDDYFDKWNIWKNAHQKNCRSTISLYKASFCLPLVTRTLAEVEGSQPLNNSGGHGEGARCSKPAVEDSVLHRELYQDHCAWDIVKKKTNK